MRDTVHRNQLTLFAEIVETVINRDRVNNTGAFVRRPPGKGWQITDYSHEKRTTWQRRKPVILPRRWRRP